MYSTSPAFIAETSDINTTSCTTSDSSLHGDSLLIRDDRSGCLWQASLVFCFCNRPVHPLSSLHHQAVQGQLAESFHIVAS